MDSEKAKAALAELRRHHCAMGEAPWCVVDVRDEIDDDAASFEIFAANGKPIDRCGEFWDNEIAEGLCATRNALPALLAVAAAAEVLLDRSWFVRDGEPAQQLQADTRHWVALAEALAALGESAP